MMMLRLEPLLVPMGNSRGGGVGLLFKDTLQKKVTSHADTFKILELIDIHFWSLQFIGVLLIYRSHPSPPPRITHQVCYFFKNSQRFWNKLWLNPLHLTYIWSLQYSTDVDDPYNTYANRFNEILESWNLKHFVSGATHANGHTLNLVISKKRWSSHYWNQNYINPVISDHYAVHCKLRVQKQHFTKKKVYYRKLTFFRYWILLGRYLDLPFAKRSSCWTQRSCGSIRQHIAIPFGSLCPFKTANSNITTSPAPWYKPEVGEHKNIRRRLGRKWRSTTLRCHREQYVRQCYVVNNFIESLKSSHVTLILLTNIHQIRRYYSRLSESYSKNKVTRVTLLFLMTLPWQIHLPSSLPARLIKYITGLHCWKENTRWVFPSRRRSFAILLRLLKKK